MLRRLWIRFLRFAFRLFYNPFAFTYDFVSAIVSRGQWRAWTRSAIPYITGNCVLEVPCGTGNLQLDLFAANHAPVAVDLSPSMLNITQSKLRRAHLNAKLARARVQQLPFAGGTFDTIIMTFPAEFIYDPHTFAEFYRVLDEPGRLVWIDGGRLASRDLWSRTLNRALDAVGGTGHFEQTADQLLTQAGFETRVEWIDRADIARIVVLVAWKK